MPNGRPGDHPLTDILVHRLRVYSERADALVREIAELAGDAERRRLADMLLSEYGEYSHPDVPRLERVLSELRDRLRREAPAGGGQGSG